MTDSQKQGRGASADYATGQVVFGRNPDTGLVEQGRVVKFTKNGWVHVAYGDKTYRTLPSLLGKRSE